MTKPRVAQPAIIKAPRANNFVGDEQHLGPGIYEKHDGFGTGGKTFTFPPSPSKQADRTGKEGLGPGSYDHEAADRLTKPDNTVAGFANQTGRGGLQDGRETGSGADPGTGDRERFYSYPKIRDTPIYSMGVKREISPDNGVPGAGSYNADSPLTKSRARAAHID